MMTTLFAIAIAVTGLSAGMPWTAVRQGTAGQSTTSARPSSQVDLSKYPAAVRATIEAETKTATLKHVSKETEKGRTQYEVETTVNGKSRDLLIDPSGHVVEVEEEIALESAPSPVQDGLRSRGKVLKLERVVRGAATSYEASVQSKTGKKTSVSLDAQGKPIKG